MNDVTRRFTIEAGAIVRGQIKQEIKGYCHYMGLGCQIEEDKSLLASTYYFTVNGNSVLVNKLLNHINAIMVNYGNSENTE